MSKDAVFSVRLGATFPSDATAYAFLDEIDSVRSVWHGALYSFLLGMLRHDSNWVFEPVQGVYCAVMELNPAEKHALVEFLRTATSLEIELSPSIGRLTRLLERSNTKAQVAFFRRPS